MTRMRGYKKILSVTLLYGLGLFITPSQVLAHCPLCTLGAGAVAFGASLFGVKYAAIGVFIGAFGLALGFWLGTLIKKQYIRYQYWLLGILSFIVTVLPLQPIMRDYGALYIALYGHYGSFLHRTYVYDTFLTGSIVGAIILLISPFLSQQITAWRGEKLSSYQTVILTFTLLISIALVFQFLV